jgi:hypothetical protein
VEAESTIRSRTLVIEVKKASVLLAALMPWTGIIPRDSLFRGHSDASWELYPSALRVREGSIAGDRIEDWTARKQFEYEVEQLCCFVDACDRQGLIVPNSTNLQRILTEYSYNDAYMRSWPNPDLTAALALAQHHGVPTRFLDWSYSPFTACFFAAEERLFALKEQTDFDEFAREPIAIWVYHSNYETRQLVTSSSVWLVKPEYAQNENLRAQSGAMMYADLRLGDDPSSLQPYDALLARWCDRCHVTTSPIFFKFLLPSGQVLDLLEQLEFMGVSAATLFPGYDGASRSIKVKTHHLYNYFTVGVSRSRFDHCVFQDLADIHRQIDDFNASFYIPPEWREDTNT